MAQFMAIENCENDLKALLDNFKAPETLYRKWQHNFEKFKKLFARYIIQDIIEWEKIMPLSNNLIIPLNNLESTLSDEGIRNMLKKLVVIKLNGGLGTTMGCSGPKSLIVVRNGHTFLDLTVNHLETINRKYDVHIPLVLMNSFNTDEAIKKTLWKYSSYKTPILCFIQSMFPRIHYESNRPIATSINDDNTEWYPPGHGDIYQSLKDSGLLREFLDSDKTVAFVSNIDNLGATVDMSILNLMSNNVPQNRPDFVMEVTDKTRADIKGGTLITYEGKLRLLEIAQVDKNHIEDFKSITKFKIFNTNNIWFNLNAANILLDTTDINCDVIVNKKTIGRGEHIIQLETAVGAAIVNFSKPIGVNVPRSRFLPVKNNSDLFLVMSNVYELNNSILSMSSKRQFSTTPLVKLSGEYFKNFKDFSHRVSDVPDIIELDHLTVSGDVTFGKGVTLKGTVIIMADHNGAIEIPSGTILENKIVSGNLRIQEH